MMLAALANPRREALLRLLWSGPRTAGELAAAHPDITFGAVSQHLRVLTAAGLVSVRREGRHRRYAAKREAFGPIAAALDAMWAEKLDDLRQLAESEAAQEQQGESE